VDFGKVHSEVLQRAAAAEIEELSEAVAGADNVDIVEAEFRPHQRSGLQDLLETGKLESTFLRGDLFRISGDRSREGKILPYGRMSCSGFG
jgi:hypothetical protein